MYNTPLACPGSVSCKPKGDCEALLRRGLWPKIFGESWSHKVRAGAFLKGRSKAMSSASLDSEASFQDRCRKIGISEDLLKSLETAGYNTFGKVSFAAASTPQNLTDQAVDEWLRTVVSPLPSAFQIACVRRLLYESQLMHVADLKSRVEGTADERVRKLPVAARNARVEEQRKRLTGLIHTPQTQPANHCVDLVVDMLESNSLKYVPMNRWTSRAQELSLAKKDPAIQVDAEGAIKVGSKAPEATCDVGGAYALRQAFLRRSLAFDLGHLASFHVMETYVSTLFEHLQRPVPKGYASITLGQIISADKELFVRAAHELDGKLQSPAGSGRPLDAAITALSVSQGVTQFLLPMPVPPPPPHPVKRPHAATEGPADASATEQHGKGKKGGKGRGGKGKGQGSRITIPDGCSARDTQNRPNCFAFNLGSCKLRVTKGRCARGMHHCWKTACEGNHAYTECTHGVQ